MRAILLAAGLGTRLRPMTLKKPKCLMEINKQPLLHIWINKLQSIGIKDVLINTHYLADQVVTSVDKFKDSLNISIAYEKELLGTAGTLIDNLNFCTEDTILIHADNVMEEDLSQFCHAHNYRPKNCLMTMLTFVTKNPKNCGIVKTNNKNIVTKFYEKSTEDHGKLANAAIYLLSKNFLDILRIEHRNAIDFSNHIIPKYLNQIYSYKTKKNFIDIGSFDQYKEANKFNI